jgi:hypothetical protein
MYLKHFSEMSRSGFPLEYLAEKCRDVNDLPYFETLEVHLLDRKSH